jgi:hypothetical protein
MRPTLETATMTTVTTPASTSLAADFATFETSTSILSMLNATTPSDPPLTTPGLVLLTRPDLSALTAFNSTDYPTIGLESDAEVLPEVSPIGQSNMELNVETTTARDFLRDVMPNRNAMACFLSKVTVSSEILFPPAISFHFLAVTVRDAEGLHTSGRRSGSRSGCCGLPHGRRKRSFFPGQAHVL